MSENNYGALMMKSTIGASDDINAIFQPGIYIIPPSNTSSPDATGGVLTVHSGTPIRRTFTSDAVICLTSTRNGSTWSAWKGPLSRINPFADIKADGTAAIAEALSNLGLPALLAAKAPLNNPELTGAVKITSKAPFIQLTESDTGEVYFIVVDGGELRIQEGTTRGPRVLSYDSVHKILSSVGQIVPGNYTNFDAKYQPKGNYTPAGEAYTKAESNDRYPLADSASHVGFVAGDTANPYMRHKESNSVVQLARRDYAYSAAQSDARYQKVNTAILGSRGKFQDANTGMIFQWGTGGAASLPKNYPIQFLEAFPNECLSIQVTLQSTSWDANSGSAMGQIIDNTQAYCWATHSFFWFAIGR